MSSDKLGVKYLIVMVIMGLSVAAVEAKRAGSCVGRWLELKNCRFELADFGVHVTAEKVLLRAPTGRWTFPLPRAAELTDWVELRAFHLLGQPVIEWKAWSIPKGDGRVQELRWQVLGIHRGQLAVLVDEVVRHKVGSAMDPEVAHGLVIEKGQGVWHVGQRHGVLGLGRGVAGE